MPDYSKIYLYRMVHIENIPHVLQNGITHVSSDNKNPNYKPIGDGSLISTRNIFLLPNGNQLGDYIPFYFGTKMPMLYVIQKGFNGVGQVSPENIVYCVTSIAKVIELNLDFIFSDGHAVDAFSSIYTPSDIEKIDSLLDKTAIKSTYWKNENDLDLKRKKEAEFLILGDIQIEGILGFIVYNQQAKNKINSITDHQNKKVIIKEDCYF